jgi:hypothetical protein
MNQYNLSGSGAAAVCVDGGCSDFLGGFVSDLDNREARFAQARFHIERGDYFATIATVCHIAAKEENIDLRRIFEKLAEDLNYLQENYEIRPKTKS